MLRPTLLLILLVVPKLLLAQSIETGFLDRTISLGGDDYKYQVYVPRDYQATAEWPVILFLHGAGERGDDGLKPAHVGLGRAIRFNPERWPAIAVFPQVPQGESWQGIAGEVAMAALDATVTEFSTDQSRLYLTGLSLGGNGTWYLGYQHTERFAALVAICSFVNLGDRFPAFLSAPGSNAYTELARDLAQTPIWIFHGDADRAVPVEESRKMAAALTAVGAEVHYTELPGIGHNAWDPAYRNEELANWLFRQHRQ